MIPVLLIKWPAGGSFIQMFKWPSLIWTHLNIFVISSVTLKNSVRIEPTRPVLFILRLLIILFALWVIFSQGLIIYSFKPVLVKIIVTICMLVWGVSVILPVSLYKIKKYLIPTAGCIVILSIFLLHKPINIEENLKYFYAKWERPYAYSGGYNGPFLLHIISRFPFFEATSYDLIGMVEYNYLDVYVEKTVGYMKDMISLFEMTSRRDTDLWYADGLWYIFNMSKNSFKKPYNEIVKNNRLLAGEKLLNMSGIPLHRWTIERVEGGNVDDFTQDKRRLKIIKRYALNSKHLKTLTFNEAVNYYREGLRLTKLLEEKNSLFNSFHWNSYFMNKYEDQHKFLYEEFVRNTANLLGIEEIVKWQFFSPMTNQNFISPIDTITEKKVLFGTESQLYCLDRKTGKTLWVIDLPRREDDNKNPIIYENKILLPYNNKIECVSLSNGDSLWVTSLERPEKLGILRDFLVLKNKQLCVIDYNNVIGVSLNDGQVLWKNRYPYISSFTYDSATNTVFLVNKDKIVVSGWDKNGKPFWTLDLKQYDGMIGGIQLLEGILYVGFYEGYLIKIEPYSGEILGKVESSAHRAARLEKNRIREDFGNPSFIYPRRFPSLDGKTMWYTVYDVDRKGHIIVIPQQKSEIVLPELFFDMSFVRLTHDAENIYVRAHYGGGGPGIFPNSIFLVLDAKKAMVRIEQGESQKKAFLTESVISVTNKLLRNEEDAFDARKGSGNGKENIFFSPEMKRAVLSSGESYTRFQRCLYSASLNHVLSFRYGYVLGHAEKCSFLGEPVWLFTFSLNLKERGKTHSSHAEAPAVVVSAKKGRIILFTSCL